MRIFSILLSAVVLLSGCASPDGFGRDWNAMKASFSLRGGDQKRVTVFELDRAIERKCKDMYIAPGKADPIDRSAVVSCYSVEIFNVMSENGAFREYVAMDCMVRNGKRSEKCGNAESVAIERAWFLRGKKDASYYAKTQSKKRR